MMMSACALSAAVIHRKRRSPKVFHFAAGVCFKITPTKTGEKTKNKKHANMRCNADVAVTPREKEPRI